jgi:hypothetical protein
VWLDSLEARVLSADAASLQVLLAQHVSSSKDGGGELSPELWLRLWRLELLECVRDGDLAEARAVAQNALAFVNSNSSLLPLLQVCCIFFCGLTANQKLRHSTLSPEISTGRACAHG